MKALLLIFIGGGLGSILRYGISKWNEHMQWASVYATLCVNVLSCILLGFITALLFNRSDINQGIRLFLVIGFCGGFSTYSTFTFDTMEFFKSGHYLWALGNIVFNFLFCALGLGLGMSIYKLFSL